MRFNRVAALCFFLLALLGNAPESISQVCNLSQIPSNLRSGLVAYYPFCGNANDVSGNGLNATLNQSGRALVVESMVLWRMRYNRRCLIW